MNGLTPEQTQNLVNNLMAKYEVTDLDALFNVPEVRDAFVAKGGDAPGADQLDARVRAITSKRFDTQTIDLEAHIIDPKYEMIRYNKEAKDFETVALGVQVATAGGRKFIKYAEFDGDESLDAQFTAAGLPGNMSYGAPCVVTNATATVDFATNATTVKLSKETSVEVRAHDAPIAADQLTFDGHIGAEALEKGWGAWRKNKKTGTFTGEFGSIDGDPAAALGTISDDINRWKLDTFGENPSKFTLKVPLVDAVGTEVQIKLRLSHLEEEFGISGDTVEAYLELAGQRILARGKGSIFWPMDAEDFDGVDFHAEMERLQNDGYLTGYGAKGNVQLNLADKSIVDETGTIIGYENSVNIGGVNVYNIVQKGAGTDNEKWEISTLAAERGGLPWFSAYETHWDNGERTGITNRNAFIAFIDNAGLATSIPEDDPLKRLLMGNDQSLLTTD